MTVKKLSEIADIWTGYSFRESISIHKKGECSILQASDVVLGKIFDDTALFSKIKEKPKNAKVLSKNDIVIISRAYPGAPFRSMLFKAEEKNVVPTSSIHIITLKTDILLPEYLLELLNSVQIQRSLYVNTAGKTTASLSKSVLQNLEINISDFEKQKKYIDLMSNMKKHKELLLEKIRLMESIQNNLIINI